MENEKNNNIDKSPSLMLQELEDINTEFDDKSCG